MIYVRTFRTSTLLTDALVSPSVIILAYICYLNLLGGKLFMSISLLKNIYKLNNYKVWIELHTKCYVNKQERKEKKVFIWDLKYNKSVYKVKKKVYDNLKNRKIKWLR